MRLFVLAVVLLVLLSGCLDVLPPEERQFCLDLTEKAYAFVPECDSEKECFLMLEKEFFSFDGSLFSSETRSGLFSYKNDVALSWLYFNNARKNVSALHRLCENGAVSPELVFNLNELVHNMSKAFEFADRANRESFAILLVEKADLEKEEVFLIKEEPLFEDLVSIEDNLNSFGNRSGCNGEQNYACFYLARANDFASLVETTGFEGSVLNEVSSFSLLESRSGEIADYLGSTFKIPFVSSVLPSFLAFLSNFFTSKAFLDSLGTLPAFEFMQSYSGFAGTENSCLERFSLLMKSNAVHRAELVKRNRELDSLAGQGILEAEAGVRVLLSESYSSFDQNFFQKLYLGLGQESSVSTQRFGIRDFGELREKSGQEVSFLKQALFAVRLGSSLDTISLGSEALALKRLNSDILALKDNLSFLEDEVVQGLLVLCDERASSISLELEAVVLPGSFLVKASDLKARTSFRLSQFEKAGSSEEKLLACFSLVEDFSLFSSALGDFEDYSLKERVSLEDCFSFLESVFESDSQNMFGLDDFSFRFRELEKIEQPYPDISYVERICLSLKQDLQSFLERQPVLVQVKDDFCLAGSMFSSLESLGFLSEKELAGFESKLMHFSEFFSGKELVLNKALPVFPELEESLSEFVSLLEKELDKALSLGTVKKTESLTLLNAASHEAVFSKEIVLECSKSVDKIALNVALLDSENLEFSNRVVFQNQSPLAFSHEKNRVSFDTGCSEREVFEIIFSVKDPVRISFELEGEKKSADETEYFYLVTLTNVLQDAVLEDVEISMGPGLAENGFLGAELFDFSGKKTGFSLLSNGRIVFSVPKILPKQGAVYYLSIAMDGNSQTSQVIQPEENENDSAAVELIKSIISEAEKNLFALEEIFSRVSDEEIIAAKYVPPISRTELEKTGLNISKLNSQVKKGSFDLDETLFEAESISARLKQSLDSIEEDAIVSYNSAAELFNQNPAGQEAKQGLESAQKSLLEGNLLKSIAESKNASGLLALKPAAGIDIPILLWPIAIATVLILVIKVKKKDAKKQKQELVKKIEKSW